MSAAQANGNLTGIPLAMFNLLQDGQVHKLDELKALLYEQDCPDTNVSWHLNAIRKHLNPKGMDVVSRNREVFLVRRLANPYRN